MLPPLRAGAAFGPVVSHTADLFGRPVNVASRLTTIARPASLLVERRLKELLGDRFRLSYAGSRRLKGLEGPLALWRVRPSGSPRGG